MFHVTYLKSHPSSQSMKNDGIDHVRRPLEKREKLNKKIGVVNWSRECLTTLSWHVIRTVPFANSISFFDLPRSQILQSIHFIFSIWGIHKWQFNLRQVHLPALYADNGVKRWPELFGYREIRHLIALAHSELLTAICHQYYLTFSTISSSCPVISGGFHPDPLVAKSDSTVLRVGPKNDPTRSTCSQVPIEIEGVWDTWVTFLFSWCPKSTLNSHRKSQNHNVLKLNPWNFGLSIFFQSPENLFICRIDQYHLLWTSGEMREMTPRHRHQKNAKW
jgi:hypothetical protein